MSDSWDINAMQFFCTDRHSGGLHGLFMDWSARKIGLKELWRLKWHKGFDLNYPLPDWDSEAPWMKKYKDYD
jgi:prepilin-type processing-associated H-X9-DG protein